MPPPPYGLIPTIVLYAPHLPSLDAPLIWRIMEVYQEIPREMTWAEDIEA